jgi:type I restriction enzyme S subunit
MSFPKYPEVKGSGVEWLGDAPAHWNLCRFKKVFQERVGRSQDGSDELLSVSAYWGVRPRSESREEGEHLTRADSLEGYKLCEAGDLVMNIMLAWNRGLGFAWQNGIVSPAYSVFSVVDGSEPRFLDYLVRSDEYTRYYKAFSAGVIDSRLRLYPEVFGRLTCALPTYDEQAHIATFLDHETARIDALIDEQQRLIELLKEKRQAVISHAVTKGLDPGVPMKDSGVEWLGEVPAHWEVGRVKNVASFITSGPRGWSDYLTESGEEIFVQSGDLNDHLNVNFATAKRIRSPLGAEGERTRITNGDVLVCITGANTGRVAVSDLPPEAAFINQHLSLVRLRQDHAFPQFVGYILSSESIKSYFRLEQYGLKEGLSLSDIADVPLVIPPKHEQKVVVEYLNGQLQRFVRLADYAKQAVELFQERRSALISAAVTGKIDVRGWQPPEGSTDPSELTHTEVV